MKSGRYYLPISGTYVQTDAPLITTCTNLSPPSHPGNNGTVEEYGAIYVTTSPYDNLQRYIGTIAI